LTSPRDEIDNWLDRDVTPLHPPAGTLDQIRRRARQRKTRQATFAAAGCAVVLAAAVVTPQLITPGQQNGDRGLPNVAAGPSTPSVQPSVNQSGQTVAPLGKGTQLKQHTTLTRSWTKPPGHFRPTSVTFVGDGLGGVIGAVIGQAGPPCASQDCTSLASTTDYGQIWKGVSAPYAPGPNGSTGVSQLRFANLSDGWAYGPALWETSRGGWPWKLEQTYGQRVIDVEAAPTRAFAVFGTCTGSATDSTDYAAGCSSFSLWTSAPGSTSWQAVSVPSGYQSMQSPTSAAPLLVISGPDTAYLLTPSGEMLSGSVNGGAWQSVGQARCKPGPANTGSQTQSAGAQASDSPSPAAGSQSPGTAGAGAQDSGAQFASGPKLLLACDSQAASGETHVTLYDSTDGASWHRAGILTAAGSPTSLASAVSGQAVLATTAGIEYSANGGRTWQAAAFAGAGASKAGPAGGFSYVGMTNKLQGVAIPADSALGSVYVTSDGGKTWQASSISGG
jgi:hypothetical protein